MLIRPFTPVRLLLCGLILSKLELPGRKVRPVQKARSGLSVHEVPKGIKVRLVRLEKMV